MEDPIAYIELSFKTQFSEGPAPPARAGAPLKWEASLPNQLVHAMYEFNEADIWDMTYLISNAHFLEKGPTSIKTFPSARLANVFTRRASLKVLKYANKASCSDFDITPNYSQLSDLAQGIPSQGSRSDKEVINAQSKCSYEQFQLQLVQAPGDPT